MRIYLFDDGEVLERLGASEAGIRKVIEQVSQGTDTSVLVVAAYFLSSGDLWRGVCYGNWQSKRTFIVPRGNWKVSARFGLPHDLTERFRLIRVMLCTERVEFPLRTQNRHYWLRFDNLDSHLAFLFGHELAHFRERFLGIASESGERVASTWAIKQAKRLGYRVWARSGAGFYRRARKELREKFVPGSRHIIVKARSEKKDLIGTAVTVIRQPQGLARSVIVQLPSGKHFYWPVAWLALPDVSRQKQLVISHAASARRVKEL